MLSLCLSFVFFGKDDGHGLDFFLGSPVWRPSPVDGAEYGEAALAPQAWGNVGVFQKIGV